MKRYIAFDGNGNSGIQTKEKATQWAVDRMSKNTAVTYVHVANIIEVVERQNPPVFVRPFLVAEAEAEIAA